MEIKHLSRPPRTFWWGFIGATVGALLLLAGLHLYADHQALHIVADYLNTHADKINKLP